VLFQNLPLVKRFVLPLQKFSLVEIGNFRKLKCAWEIFQTFLVPAASGLPETGGGAGDWAIDGHGAGGDRPSASGVSQRPAFGGLVGAGSSAIFQWGQGAVRRDIETRQSVCADVLIQGARAVVQRAARRTDTQGRWRCALTHRTGTHVAAVP
jgi:hypothetical protein